MPLNLSNTGLILEGGGMRGVYTSGVLHYFMEQELYFPYVIGVSMGACNAANYVSRQLGRNKAVNISYVNDKRYLSYLRLCTRGELFGMDFIFDTIPNTLNLFDYRRFFNSDVRCITTVTDCITGEALYYDKNELREEDYLKILRASSSLPFISKPVEYKGKILMDGGMSDSIPVRKSISDGNKRNVIILTQPGGYRKKPESMARLARIKYPRYEGLYRALNERHIRYNDTVDYIEELETNGRAFLIRPNEPLPAGRIERNKSILYKVYDQGYSDTELLFADLCRFLDNEQ